MDVQSDSFRIGYDVDYKAGDIDFFWQGVITGEPDGTVTFSMGGEARSNFMRNRLGFCILHPMECAGTAVRIEHIDGAEEDSHFPTAIAPQYVHDGQIHPVNLLADCDR